MLFSGLPFLYWFLPCVLLVYFIAPRKLKNTVLLLSSLVFYAWGEPRFVLLMMAEIIVGYGFGLGIAKAGDAARPRLKKALLVMAIVLIVGALGLFKYADFFIGQFGAAFGADVTLLGIALPIGISFYSFQLMSYLVDVYRGTEAPQKNFIDLATFIALFPQLIAGPIVRYSTIAPQLKGRTHTADKAAAGVRRFILGLAKKVLVANLLAEVVLAANTAVEPTVALAWLAAIAFALQIYFDFSGYSDMAIGLGLIFGFEFPENFNHPFVSVSATEFWRRWHISLGSWFRDYVYIPLGGNRVSKPRHILNIMVVWGLTGFWHGANWTFMVWGLFYGVLLIIEKYGLLSLLEKRRGLGHIYLLLVSVVGFTIFNANSLGAAGTTLVSMVGLGSLPLWTGETWFVVRGALVLLALAAVGATPLPKRLAARLESVAGGKIMMVLEPVVLLALLTLCTAFLVDGSFNPFLYFRF